MKTLDIPHSAAKKLEAAGIKSARDLWRKRTVSKRSFFLQR
jgi:hypothetical protein